MKSQLKSDSKFTKISLSLLLLAAMVGCAKDRSQTPAGNFFEPPSARRLSEGSTTQSEPASGSGSATQAVATAEGSGTSQGSGTIRQTSFEKAATAEPQWHISLPKAVAAAQSSNKLILADFTGSDWCPHCVTLKKKIFNTPEFKSWADQNVTLLELDYPHGSQLPPEIALQNEMLKKRYSITSYPTVLLLDLEGNVKAKLSYKSGQSPASWVQMADSRLPKSTSGSATQAVARQPSGSQRRY